MVAYSFKKQFAPPILAGTKHQTIRADRKRHARPGEEIQLYTGMRTKHCKLIGRSTCVSVTPIMLMLSGDFEGVFMALGQGPDVSNDEFARSDGFANWDEMKAFWRENHPGIDMFEGMLIMWGRLHV